MKNRMKNWMTPVCQPAGILDELPGEKSDGKSDERLDGKSDEISDEELDGPTGENR